MPIYHIERTDDYDYDETIAVVVVARDAEEALELTKQREQSGHVVAAWDTATVTEVDPLGESRVVLAHFIAG